MQIGCTNGSLICHVNQKTTKTMNYENDNYNNFNDDYCEEDFRMSPAEIAEEDYLNDDYEREAFYFLTEGESGDYDDNYDL
jgi:hypothetical protein